MRAIAIDAVLRRDRSERVRRHREGRPWPHGRSSIRVRRWASRPDGRSEGVQPGHLLRRADDGPLWVRGGVPVEAADGFEYEVRNRVTLCRCGYSKNKPFCDGSHVRTKFKDSGEWACGAVNGRRIFPLSTRTTTTR